LIQTKTRYLKKWQCPETGLLITINRYDQGEAKVQIGPRILKKKDGSDRAPVKAGRLTTEDILWLYDVMDEIKDELTDLQRPADPADAPRPTSVTCEDKNVHRDFGKTEERSIDE
jgi:hypothetical protein